MFKGKFLIFASSSIQRHPERSSFVLKNGKFSPLEVRRVRNRGPDDAFYRIAPCTRMLPVNCNPWGFAGSGSLSLETASEDSAWDCDFLRRSCRNLVFGFSGNRHIIGSRVKVCLCCIAAHIGCVDRKPGGVNFKEIFVAFVNRRGCSTPMAVVPGTQLKSRRI